MRFTVGILTVALLGCLRAAAEDEQVAITLKKDQPLSDFVDGAALTVGRPILYDPQGQRFQKTSTMGADMMWSVPKGRELDLIRSILAFYEITLVAVGPKGHEILLALDSRSTNNLVRNKAEFVAFESLSHYEDRDGLYITTAIPVRHIENLTMLRTALSTMVTPAGLGRVSEVPGANRLIVMDFAPTVAAIARLVKEMDVDPEPVVTETIVLQYAQAVPLSATLKELFGADPQPKQQGGQVIGTPLPWPRIAAYEPRNAIVVVATASDLARIREVVGQLDVKPSE